MLVFVLAALLASLIKTRLYNLQLHCFFFRARSIVLLCLNCERCSSSAFEMIAEFNRLSHD